MLAHQRIHGEPSSSTAAAALRGSAAVLRTASPKSFPRIAVGVVDIADGKLEPVEQVRGRPPTAAEAGSAALVAWALVGALGILSG